MLKSGNYIHGKTYMVLLKISLANLSLFMVHIYTVYLQVVLTEQVV